MFNSLLNVLGVDSLILDIFIILGVVVAGSLIVYFLWEAVNTLITKNKEQNKNTKKQEFVKEEKFENAHSFNLDDQKDVVVIDQKLEDVNEVSAKEEKAEIDQAKEVEDRENEARRAMLEARRQELIRRMQAEIAEEEEDEAEEEEEVQEPVKVEEKVVVKQEEIPQKTQKIEEKVEKIEEKTVKTEQKVEEPKKVEEKKVKVDTAELDRERIALAEERAKYFNMMRELEEAKKALKEQQEQQTQEIEKLQAQKEEELQRLQEEKEQELKRLQEQQQTVVKIVEQGVPVEYTLDELKEKLATAEERLRTTEKEFKQCKKEYIPLRRVWATHEKDEKKLRRKEALVAKQKVILYGVNNYADIDEEKAKKLAEDLDLLDGLKLSVQHCEEVMKKNEERYPLLEKMYNVLKLRNDELKRDIATYREEIAKFENNDETDDAE